MKKIILIILLLGLTGCSQPQDLGGGVITKEFKVKGEKVFVGGEPMLGGDELADFKPEVKLEKWGDETYIKVWSEEKGDKTASQKGDKVIWHNTDKSKEYNFYPIEDGFEYEVILKEKPKTNIISLKIKTKDLVFYYQGELEDEKQENEICHSPDTTGVSIFRDGVEYSYCFIDDDGSTTTSYTTMRPVNVIGSYAVYHATKKGHVIGQTNYMAGKAFHIYRPQMGDSNGWKVWGDLHIENGILTVEIPQDFLDKAVYPIKHATGLTFGCDPESPGSSNLGHNYNDGVITASTYTMGSTGGTVSSMSCHARNRYGNTSTTEGVGGIYDTSNDLVDDYTTAEGTWGGTLGWQTVDFSTDPSVDADTDYWLSFCIETQPEFSYDTGTENDGKYENSGISYSTSMPSTFPTASPTIDDRLYSIYATYTASGGADTCTYSSGDWEVHYSDNCFITSDPSVDGDIYLQYDGAGSFGSNIDISLTGDIIGDPRFEVEFGSGVGFKVK